MKKNKIISRARRSRKNQHMVMRVSEKKEKNRKENMSLEIMNIHLKSFKKITYLALKRLLEYQFGEN